MTIISRRRRPVHVWKHSPFAWHRSELEDRVDAFGWPDFETQGVWDSTPSAPDADLFVRNRQLIARMDLPGLTKDDVTIEVGEDQLTVRACPRARHEAHEGLDRCACEVGSFYRSVPLPEGTTSGAVTVTFTNGILEIAIPLPGHPAPDARG